MFKDVSDVVKVVGVVGWGPALILGALFRPKLDEMRQEIAIEVANEAEARLNRELVIEEKYIVRENKNKSEIERLKLQIEALEEDQKNLKKKMKHLEEENEIKSDIIEEKNNGKKLDSVMRYL